jgi:methionyl-tRNA formyltransferase
MEWGRAVIHRVYTLFPYAKVDFSAATTLDFHMHQHRWDGAKFAMKARIVVIGNGQFAVKCLRLMMACAGVAVPLVIGDPELYTIAGLLPAFCRRMKLPFFQTTVINAPDTLKAVRSARPDFVFSIYNMRIIKRPLLEIPRVATVNFHNGPLPRYRGVNIYSWAIINGEEDHGVTWHLVDEKIDAGDILGKRSFPLTANDTPVTLLSKGFRAGVDLLDEILPRLIEGRIEPQKQDDSMATYYSARDLPNGGRIDFRWTSERIQRFVRGLDFRPFENRFVYASTSFKGIVFYPQTVRHAGSSQTMPPGSIVEIKDNAILVQAADAVVALSHLLDSGLRPISPRSLERQLQCKAGLIVDL